MICAISYSLTQLDHSEMSQMNQHESIILIVAETRQKEINQPKKKELRPPTMSTTSAA